MLPLILDNLVRFCKDKDTLLPFLQENDNDGNSVMSNLTTLTGMTIDMSESGDQRVYKKDRDEGNTNTNNKKGGETNKENIINQKGKTVTKNNNNDEVSVSTILTGVDMNESPPVTNQSANTGSDSDDASHNTTLTGLTMEGEVNKEGIVNKNHPETRANTHLPDIGNSSGNNTSQNTAVMGLTMEGNTNNNT
eukprot:5852519-Ditylum_brightwellii.AAC.1